MVQIRSSNLIKPSNQTVTHKNINMNINPKGNLTTITYLLCLTIIAFNVSAELIPKSVNINTNIGSNSLLGTTDQTSTITTDTSNSNSSPLSNFRGSLRQQLRKKLISSLSFGASPAPVTVTPAPVANVKPVVIGQTNIPTINIQTSSNNASSNTIIEPPPTPVVAALPPSPPPAPLPVAVEPVPVPVPVPVSVVQPVIVQNSAAQLAKKQQDIINQVKIQIAQQSLSTKIQTIFARLPQSSELDSIILTADSYALIKTVQQAGQSTTLNCEQKVSYLSDFFGRIQIAVKMKNYTLTNLNTVIQNAKAQIKRLNQQVSRSTDDIISLGLDQLKRKLNEGLMQLSTAYGNYNRAESLIEPKKNAVAISLATIDEYKRKIDRARQDIITKKIELSQIEANISLIEQQLSDAKARKSHAQDYISNLEISIKNFEQNLTDEKNKETILESELAQINEESDRSKSIYKVLEVDVQRYRTDIAKKSLKQAEIQTAIANYQARISNQNKKIDINEQARLQNFVKDLRSVIPSVQLKIDEINYRCNGIKQIDSVSLKSGEMILFLITPKEFNSYIQASYQIKQDVSIAKPIKISLISANILDKYWQEQLGNPYSSPAYYQSSQFTFPGDFNCLAPSELETGYGIIKKVSKKSIQIQTDRNRYFLNLGACTRIESPQQIPQIGQKLYFRGRKIQEGEYNAYKVSCF